jgi:hypothetical protein
VSARAKLLIMTSYPSSKLETSRLTGILFISYLAGASESIDEVDVVMYTIWPIKRESGSCVVT